VQRRDFEQLVSVALDELPQRFRQHLQNIAVVVEEEPSRQLLEAMDLWPEETLLGLYEGVPLTERGYGYGNTLPDRITIFQRPIEDMCPTPRDIKDAVQETVLHELGHYFGLDDEQLDELLEEP
jgi:predicted Zn-dependent protease with MMP-like domain